MSSPRTSPYSNEEYTVGWICALPIELAAARGMIEEDDHGEPQSSPAAADQNRYTLGTMGKFRVVIASLPKDQLGSSSATASVKDMLFTFPNIRIGLCVGIGAGLPDYESQDEQDIRLGDVVISSSSKTGGVIAYDLGKKLADGSFETRSALAPPPRSLSTALGAMQARHEMQENKIPLYVEKMIEKHPFMRKKGYSQPDQSLDRLFKPEYLHVSGKNCSKCDDSETIEREDRFDDGPVIHYGTIASGNMVVKDSALRDDIRVKHGALCLEMEAAGLMNNFPCVVIRGISDYADSHKNDRWQPYAAAVAAACAKEYLENVQARDVDGEPTVKAVLEKVQEVQTEVTKVGKFVTTKETREILDWISPIDFVDQQNDIIRLRQDGTGTWLIDSEEFTQWVNGDVQHETLFCTGIPGAGKTIMSSIVVEHLKKTFKNDLNVKVAFEFCSYQSKHRQTTLDLLQSLLRQLAVKSPDSDLLPCILKLHQTHSLHSTRPRPAELEEAILEAIESYYTVFLIVDALDEFYSTDREDSVSFFNALRRIREHPRVKLFMTSRHNEEISSRISPYISKEIRAHDDDISQYVKGRMPQLRVPKASQKLEFQQQIQTEIVRAADGVFLLAKLHMNHLMGFLTARQIKNALMQLPRGTSGLSLAYDKVMLRILSQEGEAQQEQSEGEEPASKIALKALSWLTFSKTALTADQLVHAIGTQSGMRDIDQEGFPDPEVIGNICAGLVIFDRNTGIIRLVHHTTKTYLLKSNYLREAEVDIAKITLTYLSFRAFSTGRCSRDSSFIQRQEEYPLFTYCALNWGAHVSQLLEWSPDILELSLQFLQLETNVQASSQAMILEIYHYFKQTTLGGKITPWSTSFGLTNVHVACYFNLCSVIAHYLSQNVDMNTTDSTGKVPIMWAIENGNIESTQILLDSGRVNADCRDHDGKTLLMYAAIARRVQMAELLILRGASPDARDREGRSALAYAATTGQVAMIKLLVSQKVQLDYSHDPKALKSLEDDPDYYSLFDRADALKNDGPIFILDNVTDPVGTPLINAVSTVHKEAAVLLLENGADPNYANSEGDTPLSAAVARRNEELVKILLRRGATLEASPSTFYYAIESGDGVIVRQFLEAGADPNAIYSPPSLHRSNPWEVEMEPVSREEMMNMFNNIFQLFQPPEARAMTSGPPHVAETVLFRATRLGHVKVVHELLNYGADPNVRNGKKETPLFVASKNGHTEVVRHLLENDADPTLQNGHFQTALFPASRWATPLIVGILLNAGLSINTPDIIGSTPLFYAVESGCVQTVSFLLSKGADVGQINGMGETALFGATKYVNPEICKLLLAEGAHPDPMNILQCTPLFNIAKDVCYMNSPATKQLFPGDRSYTNLVETAILLIGNGACPSPQKLDSDLKEIHEVLETIITRCSQSLPPKENLPQLVSIAREWWGWCDWLSSLTDEDVCTFLQFLCLGRNDKVELCEYGPFYWISATGSCELVSKVLQDNEDIKGRDSGLIQGAVSSRNVMMTEMVLDTLEEDVIDGQPVSALLEAPASDGDLNMVRLLFERFQASELDNGPALIFAVKSGNTDLVGFMLANLRDPLLVDEGGLNVLHYAVLSKSPAMVQFLLDHNSLQNIDINSKNQLGFSPLLTVTQIRHENAPIARLLLQKGADPNTTETPSPGPQEAITETEEQLENSKVLDLQSLSAQEEWYHWTPLAFAAHNGADDLAQVLLEYKADPDPQNQFGIRPICLAALDGHERVVRMLLGKNVSPNQVEGSIKAPLTWALERHLDAFRYDSSKIADWPGCKAVEATVSLLLESGADPNPSDGTAPILAAFRLYSEDLVLLLIRAGSNPIHRDLYGRTPLIIATAFGMERAVAALLEIPDTPLDPEIEDVYGRSAITEATRRNRPEILSILTRNSYDSSVLTNPSHSGYESVKIQNRTDDTCTVCMVPLSDDPNDHYSCQECPSFEICKECKGWGVTCLHPGHEMS